MRGREGILKVHTRKIPLGEDVDISVLARGTPGFTGADLANLVNEAAGGRGPLWKLDEEGDVLVGGDVLDRLPNAIWALRKPPSQPGAADGRE